MRGSNTCDGARALVCASSSCLPQCIPLSDIIQSIFRMMHRWLKVSIFMPEQLLPELGEWIRCLSFKCRWHMPLVFTYPCIYRNPLQTVGFPPMGNYGHRPDPETPLVSHIYPVGSPISVQSSGFERIKFWYKKFWQFYSFWGWSCEVTKALLRFSIVTRQTNLICYP